MPLVNIKLIPGEKTTTEKKAELIAGVTRLLQEIMDKAPQTTTVIIEEVPAENWGTGGTSVAAQRAGK